MDSIDASPFENEIPSVFADRLGRAYSSTVGQEHKKKFGQFFTPSPIASFMSSFCQLSKRKIKVLDPGAGVGILSCALIEFITFNYSEVDEIELTAFETDDKIISYTDISLSYL